MQNTVTQWAVAWTGIEAAPFLQQHLWGGVPGGALHTLLQRQSSLAPCCYLIPVARDCANGLCKGEELCSFHLALNLPLEKEKGCSSLTCHIHFTWFIDRCKCSVTAPAWRKGWNDFEGERNLQAMQVRMGCQAPPLHVRQPLCQGDGGTITDLANLGEGFWEPGFSSSSHW